MCSTMVFASAVCLLSIWSAAAQLHNTPMCQSICPAYCSRGRTDFILCAWCECNRASCGSVRCRDGQFCKRTRSLGWFGRETSNCVDLVRKPVAATTTNAPVTPTTAAVFARNAGRCGAGRVCSNQADCGAGQICVKDSQGSINGRCCSKAVMNLKDRCREKLIKGPCRAGMIKHFYNTTSFQCEQFFYGGCDKGNNHFENLEDCQNECEDPCLLPKDSGICRAWFYKYYYNKDTGECQEFQYSGCLGNKNRFSSLADCQTRCVDV